ncbi:MAG: hypothetical protein OEZ34_10800 [Spirochaetia bacterium]|nr:hypothetical protein [Spirochaetia bacterium]
MQKLDLSKEIPDDITILNSHYFPESMPSSTVTLIRRSQECQERLKTLLNHEKNAYGKNVISSGESIHKEEVKDDIKPDIINQENFAFSMNCTYQNIFYNHIRCNSNPITNIIKMLVP